MVWCVLTITVLLSETSFGWGENGHRVVAEIAETRLTTNTKARVQEILGQETLAEASTWADEVRSDNKYNKYDPWHYVEIPDGRDYSSSPKNPDGDLIVGIRTTIEVLQGKDKTFTKKEALRYLVHFLGDLHQPLHVGNGKDKGGNMCVVKFAGKNTNLHTVWDTHLIGARELSFTELTAFLNRGDLITQRKINSWVTGDYVDWAHDMIKVRDSLYPPNVDRTEKDKDQMDDFSFKGERTYCKKTDTDKIPAPQVPYLSWSYEYKFKLTIDEQLQKAGVRLASVLNDIL